MFSLVAYLVYGNSALSQLGIYDFIWSEISFEELVWGSTGGDSGGQVVIVSETVFVSSSWTSCSTYPVIPILVGFIFAMFIFPDVQYHSHKRKFPAMWDFSHAHAYMYLTYTHFLSDKCIVLNSSPSCSRCGILPAPAYHKLHITRIGICNYSILNFECSVIT